MSRVASIYLSKAERERFLQVCEKESCTPYSLVKKTVLDHIWAYPLENAPASKKEPKKQDLDDGDIEITPEPETLKIEVEAVSERVRKILEGETE